jgi:hypothetical protein
LGWVEALELELVAHHLGMRATRFFGIVGFPGFEQTQQHHHLACEHHGD